MKKITFIFAAFLLVATWCHAQGVDGTEKERSDRSWPFTSYPFWIDTVTNQPEGYSADDNGDVEISTPEGLAWLPSVVNGLNGCSPNDFNGHTIRLAGDINLEAIAKLRFTPIGTQEHPFRGVFDGGGHTIDGLYIGCNADGNDDEDPNFDFGLFGYIRNATVKDITLNSGVLTVNLMSVIPLLKDHYVGGVVGFADSLSVVDGCINKMRMGINGDGTTLGGIVGMNRNSIVRNCAYVFGEDAMNICEKGGGVVYMNLSEGGYANAEVSNCFWYGYIVEMVGGGYALGGVACFNETDPKSQTGGYKAVVRNCFAESISLIRATYGGSIIGQNMDDCLMENCYGHIWNNYENAGLFGLTLGEVAECAEFLPTGPCHLLQTVAVGGISTDVMVDALNAWVDAQEDPSVYKRWKPVYDPYNIPMFEDGIEAVAETERETVGVYPNPGGNVLNICTAVTMWQPYNARVEIYDLTGKLVCKQEITDNVTSINAEDWPSGMYFWKVVADGKEIESGKWMKE